MICENSSENQSSTFPEFQLSSNLKHLRAPQRVTIKFRLELLKTLEILKFLNKSMLFCSELMDFRQKTILDVERALAPQATNVLGKIIISKI